MNYLLIGITSGVPPQKRKRLRVLPHHGVGPAYLECVSVGILRIQPHRFFLKLDCFRRPAGEDQDFAQRTVWHWTAGVEGDSALVVVDGAIELMVQRIVV